MPGFWERLLRSPLPKRPWLWGAVILLAIDKLIKSKHRVNFFHFPKKKFWRNFVIAGFKCTLWAAWILCQAKVRLQPVELQYVTFPAGWTDFISNFISLYRPNELSLPTHYSLFPLKEGMPFNFNLIDDRLSKKNFPIVFFLPQTQWIFNQIQIVPLKQESRISLAVDKKEEQVE